MEKRKILIDTDIGDEIDDALALYFAMQKNIEILFNILTLLYLQVKCLLSKKLFKVIGNRK